MRGDGMEGIRARFPAAFSSPPYLQELLARIQADIDARRPVSVLEIGGIDRPLLAKGRGYAYDGLDIESREGCYREGRIPQPGHWR